MSIPKWRHVCYTDDGCDVYQCLNCYNEWESRTGPKCEWKKEYNWKHCPYCGCQWEGEKEWDEERKSLKKSKNFTPHEYYVLQHRIKDSDFDRWECVCARLLTADEKRGIDWQSLPDGIRRRLSVLMDLKALRKDQEKDPNFCEMEYRIVRMRNGKHTGFVMPVTL